MTSALSIVNSEGRQVSLLNESNDSLQKKTSNQPKRNYHCTEAGCYKSFTTSGHLARHHRIHTGERNFHCLYPGCSSRFSRQDNMMQHYRAHLSNRPRSYPYRYHHPTIPEPKAFDHYYHACYTFENTTTEMEQFPFKKSISYYSSWPILSAARMSIHDSTNYKKITRIDSNKGGYSLPPLIYKHPQKQERSNRHYYNVHRAPLPVSADHSVSKQTLNAIA